nr:hypothetical protein 27 [bacterium]
MLFFAGAFVNSRYAAFEVLLSRQKMTAVLAKMRKTRRERIFNVVMPLISEGATIRRISEVTGLSLRICGEDAQIARELCQEDFEERVATVRGELAAKHNRLFELAISDYHNGAGTRALETAGKQLDSLARIYGVAGGINLHTHNHQASVTVTTDAVAALFQPLDAASYSEMVAAKPLPPAEDAAELEPIDVEPTTVGRDDWSQSCTPTESGHRTTSEPDEPTERKNRKVQHPLRG